MRPRHSFLKIARLRGTSVERVGFGRSDLSFIPFYSPLRNRYAFRPPTCQPQRGKRQTAISLEAILDWHFAMIEVK
jgi:hypothetical protein